MDKRFQNKVALVTGGNSGIGKSVAIGFAKEGAKVVIAARRVEEGEAVVKTIKDAGGEAIFVPTDVSDSKSVQALINTTIENYQRLDIAFNNAGIVPVGARLIDLTEEQFDRDININLKGCFLCMKYEIPHMIRQGGGAIVNTASIGGTRSMNVGGIEYCAAKAGVIMMGAKAAMEYAHYNIRINTLSPGSIMTDMLEKLFEAAPDIKANALDSIPMNRSASPEEVVGMVHFLCSDEASFITGQNFVVDGGQTLMGGGVTATKIRAKYK